MSATPKPADAKPAEGRRHAKPSFREARAGDAPAVADLLTQLGYPCTTEDAKARIAQMVNDRTQALVVVDHLGDVCGLLGLDFMYYLPLGTMTCRITALVVNESQRRTGVGKDLIKEAERRARRAGAARIELTSSASRQAAHEFYKTSGYEEMSLRFVKRLGDA
jgi:ribosomal protein S18 acetylase RimI-like enzyme